MKQVVLNIDIAPTIHDIVTSSLEETPVFMDGQSFLPLVTNSLNSTWRNDFLVSHHGEGNGCAMWPGCPPPFLKDYLFVDAKNNTYNCVRSMSPNFMYCQFMDDEHFVEYYDLEKDPWQLHNTVKSLPLYQESVMRGRLWELQNCHGDGCRRVNEARES